MQRIEEENDKEIKKSNDIKKSVSDEIEIECCECEEDLNKKLHWKEHIRATNEEEEIVENVINLIETENNNIKKLERLVQEVE